MSVQLHERPKIKPEQKAPATGSEVERERNGRSATRSLLVAREVMIVAAAGLVYATVRELSQGGTQTALLNADRVLRLERSLGLAWEGTAQSFILGHDVLVDLANWMYIWGHWPVIAVVAIALFAFRRDRYRLLRNAVLISALIGFAFFAILPTAPPRLASDGLVDTISNWSSSYRVLQPPKLTNEYAAMPSLHFGWNLLVGIILFSTTRSLLIRIFAVLMPAAMAISVVATANHWVLDVFAGGAVVLVGLFIATRLPGTHRSAVSTR